MNEHDSNMWIVVDSNTYAILQNAGKFVTQDDAFTWMWKNGNTGQWITIREDRYQRYLQLNEGA